MVEVNQSDRDAAAAYAMGIAESGLESVAIRWIKDGRSDDAPIVQAFAMHRQKARNEAFEEASKVSALDLAKGHAVAISDAIRALKSHD